MARSEIFGGSVDVTYHTWMQCFDEISKFAMSRSEKESLLEVVFRRICDQIRTRNFEKECDQLYHGPHYIYYNIYIILKIRIY